jgi:poly(3-hydroxybutyrate) depolymerase
VAYTGTFAGATGRYNARLRVAGLDRDVTVYAPRNRGARPPLVLAFHGTNGDGATMLTESGARALADAQGVVVVAPSSRWLPRGDWDHPGGAETYWETSPITSPDQNADLLLVRASIVEAIRVYNVDPDRVYAIGHSNGAFFTHLVATSLRDRVAAFASSSGGLVRCATTPSCGFRATGTACGSLRAITRACNCTGPELPVATNASGRRPPAYLTHGTDDPMVSVEYTCALASRLSSLGFTVRTSLRNGDGHSLPETFAQDAWAFMAAYRRQ